jgi:regulatory protein
MSDDDENKPKKRRRGPRKATASYLENSAAHYLGRFATSSAHLRQLMMQKVQRSVAHHGTDPADGKGFVDTIIAKFERLGFLDDQAYGEMRARSLHAKGTPVRGIRYKLQQKGLSEDNIDAALAALADEAEVRDLDLSAALRLARRRRLGPYLSDDRDVRDARREKDMAVLARAGFSYDVVCQVLDANSAEELELAVAAD